MSRGLGGEMPLFIYPPCAEPLADMTIYRLTDSLKIIRLHSSRYALWEVARECGSTGLRPAAKDINHVQKYVYRSEVE